MKEPRESPFVRCALAAELLPRDRLNQAWSALSESDPEAAATEKPFDERLAAKLVEQGDLTHWQAQQLLAGRTKFRLGDYRVIDSLGRGGMSRVFKGEHLTFGRIVALKVVPRSEAALAGFRCELQAQARLDHPHLVRAFDVGEDGNVCYLVTEYVPGCDLRRRVRTDGPMSMAAAAAIIRQIAAALHHAHKRGIIHRDVKPGNILVMSDGCAKLSDLGLAGSLRPDDEADLRFGRLVGTADYLSPDHIHAPGSPTPAWDVYSLGCTLYYAVTGKVPFPGGTTPDKIQAHLTLQPLDPRRLNPTLSNAFVELLAAMMAKQPSERPTAAEIIARLQPWCEPNRLTFGLSAPDGDDASSMAFDYTEPPEPSGYEDTQTSLPQVPATAPSVAPAEPSPPAASEPVRVEAEEAGVRPLPRVVGPARWRSAAVLIPLGLAAVAALAWGITTFFL